MEFPDGYLERRNARQRQCEAAPAVGQATGDAHENVAASPECIAHVYWTDQQAPLPAPPPQELHSPKPTLLTGGKSEAATPEKPMSTLLDASNLKGRRIHLCLAPDQAAQQVLSDAAEGAGSDWVKRWGGWHVPVGRPVLADSIDATAALASAAGEWDKATCPWELRSAQYSLRIHKCGFGLPCCCQSLLKHVTRDEAVWMGPSKQLMVTAGRLQKLGWTSVEASDFRLTLGPREEVRHVLSDMVAALWDARWVWLIAVEQTSGSGKYAFDWDSAKPAMVIPVSHSED